MAIIGLQNLYYAKLTVDNATTVTYTTPTKIAGAINAKISPKSSSETLYADNQAFETVNSFGNIDVELEMAELPLSVQADLLGYTVDKGVMIATANAEAPYVAIGFESLKSNGKKRLIWLYKGKFALPDEESATKEDKAKFSTAKIKATFIPRIKDGFWKKVADSDSVGFEETTETAWFTSVS